MSNERHDTATGIEGREGADRRPTARAGPKAVPSPAVPLGPPSVPCAVPNGGELRPSSALLTMDQVALRLGTSLRHMRRLVAERRIPIVKVGHLVRFDGHDIEHWVDDHRVDVVVPAAVAIRAARMQRRLERDIRRAG